MIRTMVTKEQLEVDYAQSTDLGALIAKLESEFSAKGQVICQFKLNGMNLSEADEKRLSAITMDEIQFIEVHSESPTALLFGLLDNWILELPKLLENTDALAKEIRFKGIEGHLKSFVELIDSCQFLMESLVSLEQIIQASAINQTQWRTAETSTMHSIGEALRAFEKKDFVLLSEILEYDLAHALQIWLDMIKSIGTNLRDENARDSEGFAQRVFKTKG